MPARFFRDRSGSLCAGLADDRLTLDTVGDMRGLYLWDHAQGPTISVSSGDFTLMNAVTVTAEEEDLAKRTSPPHVLLLLHRLGVGRVCDPVRESALTLPRGQAEWKQVLAMSHEEVVRELAQLSGWAVPE